MRLPCLRRRLDLFTVLDSGLALSFPQPTERIRPGSMTRSLVLTDEPALIRLIAGMNFLEAYEHACTEQRVSSMYPLIALKGLFRQIGLIERYRVNEAGLRDLFTRLATMELKHERIFTGLLDKITGSEPNEWTEAEYYFRA
ncbi:hypothetical protein LCGC14_2416710, partial [marine sediment metagenome]